MSTFAAIPADLEVICVQGDQLDIAFDVSLDLTGYDITALVYEAEAATPGGWTGGDAIVVGNTAATFSINVVDLELGQFNIGLTETQTQALSPSTAYRWYVRWADPDEVTRTAVSGVFRVRVP